MIKRTIEISSPTYLKSKLGQLIIEKIVCIWGKYRLKI